MNWLDYLLGTILIASTMAGLWKGFTRTIVGMITVVVALLVGLWFYGAAGALVAAYVSHPSVANFLGFAAVFVLVSLVGSAVGWFIVRVLKKAGLGWLDRLLGAAFGLLRGGLFSLVIILAISAFARTPPPEAVVHSRVAPYVIEGANVVSYLAPKELRDSFAQSYEKAKKIWQEMWKLAPAKL